MGRVRDVLDDQLARWVENQPVFFVATAPTSTDGHLNCSPKGNRGELAVLDGSTVAYLDQTGSGTETIAHLSDDGRIVLMFCAFEGPPRIVRVHGRGRALLARSAAAAAMSGHFAGAAGVGVRSVIVVDVERVSDSCGYGVPLMHFAGHRPTLDEWIARKGRDGIEEYWKEKNASSVDGLPGVL